MPVSRQNVGFVAALSCFWNMSGLMVRSLVCGVVPLLALALTLTQVDLSRSLPLETSHAAHTAWPRAASYTVRDIDIAADGRTAWIIHFPAIVRQIDLQTGSVLKTVSIATPFASDMQLTSSRLNAAVYETEHGTCLQTLHSSAKPMILPASSRNDVQFSVDSVRDVIAISSERTLELRSLETMATLRTVTLDDAVSRMKWADDGSSLLIVLVNGTLQKLDGQTLAVQLSHPTPFVGDTELLCAWEGNHAALCTSQGVLVVWDFQRNELRSFPTQVACLRNAALSPDGRWFAYSDEHDQIWLYSVDETEERQLLGTSSALINAISFNPDGQSLLIGGMDGCLESWSLTEAGAEWSTPFVASSQDG